MSMREVAIRELRPGLASDYLAFFDDVYDNDPWLKSSGNPWWGGCYCTFYDDVREEDAINASPAKRAENRAARQETIGSGKATGLLAYADGKVVGWCNVAPQGSYANPRHMRQAMEDPAEKVGSITCFVVSSGYRRLGIAPRLLESACGLVRRWGLPVAEGYPRNPELKTDNQYRIPEENLGFRGSLNMFLAQGFEVHCKFERFLAVRKRL